MSFGRTSIIASFSVRDSQFSDFWRVGQRGARGQEPVREGRRIRSRNQEWSIRLPSKIRILENLTKLVIVAELNWRKKIGFLVKIIFQDCCYPNLWEVENEGEKEQIFSYRAQEIINEEKNEWFIYLLVSFITKFETWNMREKLRNCE